jgi:hypothetical protein
MDSSLRLFVRQFAWVVAATLLPVALLAFLSIPYNLGGHPGEQRRMDLPIASHMT